MPFPHPPKRDYSQFQKGPMGIERDKYRLVNALGGVMAAWPRAELLAAKYCCELIKGMMGL